MLPAILGGLIGAAGSVLGGAIQGGTGLASTNATNKTNLQISRETNALNERLQQQAFQQNRGMWNEANAYNSPSAQMDRLKAANLNPNLVYGSGSVVGNTSTSTPQAKASTAQAAKMMPWTGTNLGLNSAGASLQQMFMDRETMKNMAAQRGSLNSQADFTRQQAITEGMKQAETAARTARSKFDLKLAEDLRDTTLQAASANLHNTIGNTANTAMNLKATQQRMAIDQAIAPLQRELSRSQILNLKMSTAKLIQDKNFGAFEQDMKRQGIYPNDPMWARLTRNLYNFIDAAGSDD